MNDVGQLGDGQSLGRVEKRRTRADRPSLSTSTGLLFRRELVQELGDTGQGLDTLSTGNGGGLGGVDRRVEAERAQLAGLLSAARPQPGHDAELGLQARAPTCPRGGAA